jgi:four helix bundle protein
MNIKYFRSYELAVNLHKEVKTIALPGYLKDQLLRASSSIALNLAEGSAKTSKKDRLRYYGIALGSLREVQAIADLEQALKELEPKLDILGAHIYKLVHQ